MGLRRGETHIFQKALGQDKNPSDPAKAIMVRVRLGKTILFLFATVFAVTAFLGGLHPAEK